MIFSICKNNNILTNKQFFRYQINANVIVSGKNLTKSKLPSVVPFTFIKYLADVLVSFRKTVFAHFYQFLGCFKLLPQTVDVKLIAFHFFYNLFQLS